MDRWETAQKAEREFHDRSTANYFEYMDTYRQYLKFFCLDFQFIGKTILEIGPADYPCLRYLKGYTMGTIIEPMPSERLEKNIRFHPINLIKWKAEEVDFPKVDFCFLFNVLQHVEDPAMIVRKAKEAADRVLFFEPLENGVSDTHLWDLTPKMFKDWFGSFNTYPGNNKARNFHTDRCAWGDWHKHKDTEW